MKIARIAFGLLYLSGAVTNTILVILNGPASYNSFADAALLSFYREAWASVAVPNMTLFVSIFILYELTTGLLFLIRRRFMTIALVAGTIFCLGTVPFSLQVLSTNLPLGLIQAFLLWRELRRNATMKIPKTVCEVHLTLRCRYVIEGLALVIELLAFAGAAASFTSPDGQKGRL